MRIAFMGSPAFAADILQDIHENVQVEVVYTRQDAVRGRGKELVATPVKTLAIELGIPVREPRTLRDEAEQEYLRSLDLDAIVVAAYGRILPKEVLDIPRFGCINVHASLLPRWRGAAPIERAILAGDEQAGVCIMRMEEGLDTGDYCVSRSIPIGDMDSETLTSELASLGAVALITALDHIEAGTPHWVSQDESGTTYANKLEKGELDVTPSMSAVEVQRRVRASSAAHPCKCSIAGRGVTLLDVRVASELPGGADRDSALEGHLAPGSVVYRHKRLFLVCADGPIEVLGIKPDGKGAMDARSFAGGSAAIRDGEARWGAIDAA